MEKRYLEGKEIISKCSWCEKKGAETYTNDGKIITDLLDIWEIEEKLQQDIAIISHSICSSCMETLYPDMCKDDGLNF